MISAGTTGYFGALDPDHGITATQEFEYLMINAAPLGRAIKHNHDTMTLAKLPAPLTFPTFAEGQPSPTETTFDTMLNGAGARALFGDPAYRPIRTSTCAGPYELTESGAGPGRSLKVRLKEKLIYGAFTDVFNFGLGGGPKYVNNKMYITVPVDGPVSKVTVKQATCGVENLTHGLLAHAVEQWGGQRTLHVQLDFPYGKFKPGCEVELTIH